MRPRPESENIRPNATMNKNQFVTQAVPNTHPASVIFGAVNANGSIASGVGFTINRTGVGGYEAAFTIPFSDIPSVTYGIVQTGALLRMFGYFSVPVQRTGFTFTIGAEAGGGAFSSVDSIWYFQAMGQRS